MMKAHPQRDPRKSLRQQVSVGAKLRIGGANYAVELCDLSIEGFRFRCIYTIAPGQRCVVKLETFESMGANIMWVVGDEGGCQFERPLHASVAAAIAQRHPGLLTTG